MFFDTLLSYSSKILLNRYIYEIAFEVGYVSSK